VERDDLAPSLLFPALGDVLGDGFGRFDLVFLAELESSSDEFTAS
jgi:hypothetical protein